MRLTCWLFGREVLAIDVGPATESAEDDPLRDLGATGGQFVGFTARHEVPDDVSIHRPTSPWEDDSEARR